MFGFIQDLSDFFAGLFSSDPHLVQARKALREIHDNIQSQKPLLYQKSTNLVTPALPQAYYNLFSLLAPLMDLFDRTIHNSDKKIRDLSLQFYIESTMVGDITQRRLNLGYEAIKARLVNAANAGQEALKINTDFTNLMTDIKRQIAPVLDQEISELMSLKNLVHHNISPLFKKCGYDLADFGKKKPSFQGVDGDTAVADLLDLYYVLAPLKSVQILARPLTILLERLSPQTAEEQSKKITKLLERVEGLLRSSCSPVILLNIIQAIRKDPDLKAETAKPESGFLQAYVEQISVKFTSDRDRAVREVGEDALTKDLAALFGQAPLLPFRGYDSTDNERLIGAGLDPFSHVKALSVFKSFCEAVLKTYWLTVIKKLILDAFWVEKDYGNKFGNQYYQLEGIFDRMEELERALFSDGKASHATLEKHLKRDNVNAPAANRVVESINRMVIAFLETETEGLLQMARLVGEALSDYKNPSPERITNIKSLGGKANREVVQGLLDGYNKTSGLLKIMRNFIVVKGS